MRIGGAADLRRDTRYQFTAVKAARLKAASRQGEGSKGLGAAPTPLHDATVRDISAGGVSLNTSAKVDSSDLVELQMDGLPPMPGKVVRAYGGVVAIQFQHDENARLRLEREVGKLNAVA